MQSISVFTYGSLMYASVFNRLVSKRYESINAELHGFRRLHIRGDSYPVLQVASHAHAVDGRLYRNVRRQDLARLDRFEGPLYMRMKITVTQSGRSYIAFVYLLRNRFRCRYSSREWNAMKFFNVHSRSFQRRYVV